MFTRRVRFLQRKHSLHARQTDLQETGIPKGHTSCNDATATQLTQLLTSHCDIQIFSRMGAEVLIPQYTSTVYENYRRAQGAKLRSAADLTLPRGVWLRGLVQAHP